MSVHTYISLSSMHQQISHVFEGGDVYTQKYICMYIYRKDLNLDCSYIYEYVYDQSTGYVYVNGRMYTSTLRYISAL